MVQKRSLPKAHNFMVEPENSPTYEDLVERRRLGQTSLLKCGQSGVSGAARPKNQGTFDYAHLRAPLPPDLDGSELFSSQSLDSYFLMRRSSDGYVSASGMFKVAFPWAAQADEDHERKYLKGLPTTSQDETAGNIWIPPTQALELADLYKLTLWIRALLDPAPIEKGVGETKKPIAPPPTFVLPDEDTLSPVTMFTPNPGRGRGRLRSSSPGKAAQSSKKMSSPRKRTTKASAAANLANANAASANLRGSVDDSVAGVDHSLDSKETVHVEVDSTIDTNGDVETEYTNVKVALRSDLPGPPQPVDTVEMIATARKMVEEARELDGLASKGSSKRKADELDEDDDDDDDDDDEIDAILGKPVKKTKVLEEQLKKERVKTKALLGLSATLAIGAIVPYVF